MSVAEFTLDAPKNSWDDLTEARALATVFEAKFGVSTSNGRDRITASAFSLRLQAECAVIERKARADSYQFSPYLERLVTKGRGKEPRVLSVPGIRDRIVLHQLKDYLHARMPSAVRRTLPNEYIRTINAELLSHATDSLSFVRADIKAFYDCIPHSSLLAVLKAQSLDERVTELTRRAICTPTHAKNRRRTRAGAARNRIGVPQGLAVSNALANLYLHDLDVEFQQSSVIYARYVDDILIVVPTVNEAQTLSLLREALVARGLTLNEDKSYVGPVSSSFEFLGYKFAWPVIGVRRATVERFLHAVAAMITRFRSRSRQGKFPKYLTKETRLAAFVDELNEKITGAISENRRYGWLFYFSEINDQHLLYSLDHELQRIVLQIEELQGKLPAELKRLVRAFHEVRFSPERGYIHNYNTLSSIVDRLSFLVRRGRVDPEQSERMTEAEINEMFETYRQEQLSKFERDVGTIY